MGDEMALAYGVVGTIPSVSQSSGYIQSCQTVIVKKNQKDHLWMVHLTKHEVQLRVIVRVVAECRDLFSCQLRKHLTLEVQVSKYQLCIETEYIYTIYPNGGRRTATALSQTPSCGGHSSHQSITSTYIPPQFHSRVTNIEATSTSPQPHNAHRLPQTLSSCLFKPKLPALRLRSVLSPRSSPLP
jgi:hypothetical protein